MAKKIASKHIQKWEYTNIYCSEIVIGFDENKEQVDNFHILAERKKAADPYKLDPAIPLPTNEKVTWQLAWSDKHKHWANIKKVLNEAGEEGWELVSVTPPWNSVALASNSANIGTYVPPYYHTNHHYFYLLLKRPKE